MCTNERLAYTPQMPDLVSVHWTTLPYELLESSPPLCMHLCLDRVSIYKYTHFHKVDRRAFAKMCLFCGPLSLISFSKSNNKPLITEKRHLLYAPGGHSHGTLEPGEQCQVTNLLLLDPLSPNLFDQGNPFFGT